MRGEWKGLGLAVLVAAWALGSACGGDRPTPAAAAAEAMPPGLLEALKGRQTGDLLPTNTPAFQLQLSKLPAKFIVRMNAPRDAVAPLVSAYFRNLGIEDIAMLGLMWCESARRGTQDVWSCNH